MIKEEQWHCDFFSSCYKKNNARLVSGKKDFQRDSHKIIQLHKMPLQIRNLDKQGPYQILGNLSIFLVGVFQEN